MACHLHCCAQALQEVPPIHPPLRRLLSALLCNRPPGHNAFYINPFSSSCRWVSMTLRHKASPMALRWLDDQRTSPGTRIPGSRRQWDDCTKSTAWRGLARGKKWTGKGYAGLPRDTNVWFPVVARRSDFDIALSAPGLGLDCGFFCLTIRRKSVTSQLKKQQQKTTEETLDFFSTFWIFPRAS